MSVYLHACGDPNWKLHSGELHRLASYQKDDGANTKHERCRRLYDQQITMGQGIFCRLPELDLAFSECQPAIQIVRHALFKRVDKISLSDTLVVFPMCLLFSPCSEIRAKCVSV